MIIKRFVRGFVRFFKWIAAWSEEQTEIKKPAFEGKQEPVKIKKVYSVWDFVEFKKGSQADHLSKVIGFDEWVPMDEIRRRIKEIVGIEYLNERSLYPYIKTMVDVGFFEAINVGGVRKWRKNEFLFEISEEDEKKELKSETKTKIKLVSKNN